MGELFANFEPYSVAETRRISRAEGKEEGVKEGIKEGDMFRLVRQICRKLERGKDLATICDVVEEQETIVKPIYDIAIGYAPDYSPGKVMEQLGKTVSDENV